MPHRTPARTTAPIVRSVTPPTYGVRPIGISSEKPQPHAPRGSAPHQTVVATVSLSASIMRSRMTNFWTLPVTVIGISVTKRI
ncbi:hypothetical protein LMG10661_01069 [Ralstonia syzygii subsp. syzygii]|nr:hypothetical protein LMG10661_01069 [Ralstonia syzygii subsp. syzygii]